MYILVKHPNKMKNEDSECSDSAKDEIKNQLEECEKHSGKEATEIDPKPERFISKRMKKTLKRIRERLNATFILSSIHE